MGAYLFIGGPWDQRWREVPDLDVLRVPVALEPWERPDRFGSIPRTHLYYRRRAVAPGWLIPLTFYVSDPVLQVPIGTVLPGGVQGMRPDASLSGAWRYVDFDPSEFHAAVRAFNRERLAR